MQGRARSLGEVGGSGPGRGRAAPSWRPGTGRASGVGAPVEGEEASLRWRLGGMCRLIARRSAVARMLMKVVWPLPWVSSVNLVLGSEAVMVRMA